MKRKKEVSRKKKGEMLGPKKTFPPSSKNHLSKKDNVVE